MRGVWTKVWTDAELLTDRGAARASSTTCLLLPWCSYLRYLILLSSNRVTQQSYNLSFQHFLSRPCSFNRLFICNPDHPGQQQNPCKSPHFKCCQSISYVLLRSHASIEQNITENTYITPQKSDFLIQSKTSAAKDFPHVIENFPNVISSVLRLFSFNFVPRYLYFWTFRTVSSLIMIYYYP